MGAAESIVRNVDKRTARRENRDSFMNGIVEFRSGALSQSKTPATSTGKDELDNVKVYVRKRPIFEHELKQSEFDVVTCVSKEQLTIHDARMQADMKGRFLDHHSFLFTEVFSEHDDTDKIFDQVVKPVCDIVQNGGNGCCLMYGQTGSGKTFTMSGIHKRVSWELFHQDLDVKGQEELLVSFVELAGDSCFDVLNERAKLQLLTCPNGDVMTYPATQVAINSPQELLDCIQFACGLRATAATGVHDQSSRSHALCRIELKGGNSLTLVDLAGSEHRIDSASHDSARRKESAEINSSLMKLKECIRARARRADYIPYRQSRLTHLLRPSFTDSNSSTIIIATVSPSSKDTEHSLNTLRHACIMDGQDQDPKETRWVTGGATTRQILPPVDVTALARKRKVQRDKIRKSNHQQPGWSAPPPKTHSRDGSFDRVAKATMLKKEAREREKRQRQLERQGLQKFSPDLRRKLEEARENRGVLQRTRMADLQYQAQLEEQRQAQLQRKEQQEQAKREQQRRQQKQQQDTQEESQKVVGQPESLQIQSPKSNNNLSSPRPSQISPPPAHDVQTGARLSYSQMMHRIRQKVWSDNRVPEHLKEEYILNLAQRYKQELEHASHPENDEEQRPSPREEPAATVAQSSVDRHVHAKKIRQQKIEQEQRLKEERLRAKMDKGQSQPHSVDELQKDIMRLGKELNSETDRMKKYAIKTKLAKAKAALIKIERKKKEKQNVVPAQTHTAVSQQYDPLEMY